MSLDGEGRDKEIYANTLPHHYPRLYTGLRITKVAFEIMSSETEAMEGAVVLSDQSNGCESALTAEDPAQIGRRTQ